MIFQDQAYIPYSGNLDGDNAVLGLILVTAVMYIFFFILQKVAGPVYLSQIGYVIVAMGLVFGYFLFGEHYDAGIILPLGLLIAALILTNRRIKN